MMESAAAVHHVEAEVKVEVKVVAEAEEVEAKEDEEQEDSSRSGTAGKGKRQFGVKAEMEKGKGKANENSIVKSKAWGKGKGEVKQGATDVGSRNPWGYGVATGTGYGGPLGLQDPRPANRQLYALSPVFAQVATAAGLDAAAQRAPSSIIQRSSC